MGCTDSKPENSNIDVKEENKANKEIDNMLKKQKKDMMNEIKLLLLGTGESGKSTIAKQMRILHCGGFSKTELLSFKPVIINNTIGNMKILIDQSKKFGININPDNKEHADYFATLTVSDVENFTTEMAEKIKKLWADEGIRETYEKRNEYQIMDSASYCFEHVDKFASDDYCPDEADVLRARSMTTGIIETPFQVNNANFRMLDVGGQRSERKKWIHCFEDVTAIIYCVALNEYDMKLYEDEKVNRMVESLELFEEICNSKWFTKTAIIIFLNKSDLFRDKIKKVSLSVLFKDYAGGNEYDAGISFIQQQFVGCNRNAHKKIFAHVTQATSTENVKVVFDSAKEIIIAQNLERLGFGHL